MYCFTKSVLTYLRKKERINRGDEENQDKAVGLKFLEKTNGGRRMDEDSLDHEVINRIFLNQCKAEATNILYMKCLLISGSWKDCKP